MKRKLFCILLSLSMLLCFMPQAAWAENLANTSNTNPYTYNIDEGKIRVTVNDDGVQTVEQFIGNWWDSQRQIIKNDTNIPAGSEIILTQRNSITSTRYYIDISAAANQTIRVTLKDVNINPNDSSTAPLSVYGSGNVIIELDGTNKLDAGSNSNYPGLYKGGSGTVTICDDNSVNGNLEAGGGSYTNHGAAGIGGSGSMGFGDASGIIITGGTIVAKGYQGGAGIGGGRGGSASNITITGGNVTAIVSGNGGAGIGGGREGSGSNITITGGTVTATGSSYDGSGAGIGGGNERSGSNITITGGTVVATGGGGAAGIGGSHDYYNKRNVSGSNITISGGNVTAIGGDGGAAIGGGKNGSGTDITISGNAQVKVKAGKSDNYVGAGIGNGATDNAGGTESGTFTGLTANGWVKYYSATANIDNDPPTAVRHYGNIEKHDITSDISISSLTNATCTAVGSVTITCSCNVGTKEIPALGHTLTHIEAKSATYSEAGNIEYWKCSVCNACFTDEHGTKPIDESATVIPKLRTGHTSTQYPTVAETTNGTITLAANGRSATITPDAGYEIASVTVNGEDKGAVAELTGLRTGDKIAATFQKTKETLDAEVKTATAALSSMKARSSKTAKGNVKVVAKLSDAEKAQVAKFTELGYTVKYRFYRSTNKASSYKAMLEKSSTAYTNTAGKKDTRYYYKVQIRVYDADGTLVAKTELKNCKYATRIFG